MLALLLTRLVAFVVAVCAALPLPAGAANDTVLIKDATLIDGNGGPAREDMDLLVENGVITRIEQQIEHPTARVVDAAGKTVLPGLIDCHTHLNSVPGAQLRGDSAAELDAARKTQLRAYLAAGVTTVLDTAAPPSVLGDMRAYVEDTNLGPRIEGLAPILTPENGYFADENLRADYYPDLWGPIGDDLDLIDAHFADAARYSPAGVKVTVEDGYGPSPVWPLFDDEALARIRKSAAEHDSPIYAHAIGPDEYLRALELEPYAIVHGGFMQAVPTPDALKAVKASGAVVISTVAISDMQLLTWQTDRLESPWLKRLVPEVQRATAADAEISEEAIFVTVQQSAPAWLPEFLVRLLAPIFYNESTTEGLRSSQMNAIKAMYDAGIPIVMGADMGNWPLFTSLFHGVGSIREMELLEQAGLPREEVIVAATSRAARLLKKSHTIGSIEVGKRADLMIANTNPLDAGMVALRDLAFVMKDGEMRTPDGWMRDAAK